MSNVFSGAPKAALGVPIIRAFLVFYSFVAEWKSTAVIINRSLDTGRISLCDNTFWNEYKRINEYAPWEKKDKTAQSDAQYAR